MFAIQRFDGSAARTQIPAEQAGNGPSRLDKRIALLNQKNTEAAVAKASEEAKADGAAVGAGGLKIHPSRLAASHILRQSDRKARSSLNGTAKEKTKAKQRYLNRKKDRRKKRKVVTTLQNASKKKKEQGIEILTGEHDEGAMEVAGEVESSDGLSESSPEDDSAEEDEYTKKRQEDATAEEKDVEMTDRRSDDQPHDTPNIVDDEEDALIRLPAAQRTSQASKRDLAAQGLPAGLANPIVVDAAYTDVLVSKSAQRPLDLISDSTRKQLSKIGIKSWFAVQTAIIPKLLDHPTAFDLYPYRPPGDICVSAPTGSGKTLSYVVPIIEVLAHRVCRRVRALILLPTRDLVHQVRETLEAVAKGTNLTVASLTGQQSFAQEQAQLVDAPATLLRRHVPGLLAPLPGSQEEKELFERNFRAAIDSQGNAAGFNLTIESKVDIVIATPGRLIDHMDQTPGFTLQHLRFLVIDEADRLLSQSFQEWLPRILDAIDPRASVEQNGVVDQSKFESALHPAWLLEKRLNGNRYPTGAAAMLERRENSTQKLLFSATLTRDPAKIVALQLRNASFVSVEEPADGEREAATNWHESFALPATLNEHLLVTSTANKPLDLLYLLYVREPEPLRQVLCFTKSVESASRLVKLLEFFDQAWRSTHGDRPPTPLRVREHSSDLRGAQRNALLNDVRSGSIDVVICSDVIARGIDLPDVRHVISYDAPVDMAKYVHRVGRTARANRVGDAWTLVEEQEARHFTRMIKRAGRKDKIHRLRLPKTFVRPTADDQQGMYADVHAAYKQALRQLEQHFSSSSRMRNAP